MLKVKNSNEHCTSESAHNTVHTYTVYIEAIFQKAIMK